MKVTIIGSGNVAEAFAVALKGSCHSVVEVFARNEERGRQVAQMAGCEWCGRAEALKPAELYLLCVSDRAIVEVASALPFTQGAIVAHTAGCGTIDMLPAGLNRAVIYPFQTFSKGRVVDFSQFYLFIEADSEQTHKRMAEFALSLTSHVADADALLRSKIHLTGVIASNFVNNMYSTAAEVLAEAGLGFDVVAPVIAETAAKALDSGCPAAVQTGPAVRGDRGTMERHRVLIADNALLRDIYDKISENIWRIREISKR